ncbi:MAG: hypothetical protein PHZ25_00305 [Candidatus Pacebacteria bacterium]|nr:hypothetical protein [Candidatus Paceibacterota bacterium]
METIQVYQLSNYDLVKRLVRAIETYERNFQFITDEQKRLLKEEGEFLEAEVLRRLDKNK